MPAQPIRRSLKYRRLSVLSSGMALLLALVLLAGQRWYAGRQALLDDLTVQAGLIGANASAALIFNDGQAAGEMLGALRDSPMVIEAALYRNDGSRLATYGDEGELGFGGSMPPPGREFSLQEVRLVQPVQIENRVLGAIALRGGTQRLYTDLLHFIAGFIAVAAVVSALAHLAGRRLRLRMAAAEAELEHLALNDQLTGLPNRYAFHQALERTVAHAVRSNTTAALLYLDADGFKKVNDLFGHSVGDRVLQEVAGRLRGALRRTDMVARLGGDEFAVVLHDVTSPDDAARVAEYLIKLAAEPFPVDDHPAYLGLSIGIAMIPGDGDTAERLLHNADLAMYQAKERGRGNCQFFSDRIGEAVRRRLDIEAELRTAIHQGQIYLAYQPQVEAAGGALRGLEALARWRHPERGIISPAEFIPVAEESSLIVELGRHVFALACADIVSLRAAGFAVPPVAVNVSVRQLSSGRFADEIAATLREHRLSTADVEIELTESAVMDRPEENEPVLAELKVSGMRIAIDDFGTGYSSLSYLKRLPVGKVKIDRSFVRDLPENAESVAIAKSIIDMAHALGLKVVAEGGETAAQVDCLHGLGCDLLQGYYTGRPMEREALVDYLRERS
jgi:diguanylate cyclase (GGDEF)-like protein